MPKTRAQRYHDGGQTEEVVESSRGKERFTWTFFIKFAVRVCAKTTVPNQECYIPQTSAPDCISILPILHPWSMYIEPQ